MMFAFWLLTLSPFLHAKGSLQADSIQELPPPTISILENGVLDKGDEARIECRCPNCFTGSTFYLNRKGKDTYDALQTIPPNEDTATFIFSNLSLSHQGRYQCFYRKKMSGRWMTSKFSDTVEITVRDDASKPQVLHLPVNIRLLVGMVAGGVLLVLVVSGSVWYTCRKIRNYRRTQNNRNSLWTTLSDNNGSPYPGNNGQTLHFSGALENPREQEEDSDHFTNYSTEYLNDMPGTPRALHGKAYFITFREQ